MVKKEVHPGGTSLEPVYRLWGWILLVWSLYRYFFKLPETIDEFILKPLVFVVPVVWYVLKYEKRPLVSLGLTSKNLKGAVLIGIGFGAIFVIEGIAANVIKYGNLNINPITAAVNYGVVMLLLLSLATSFSEELLNRGFIFNRIFEKTKNLAYASFLSTVLFVLLHVPILVTSLKLQGLTLILFFFTNFILGMVNALLFANTRSLLAPILVHVFWNMTVAFFL